jgi:hypothetical protein
MDSTVISSPAMVGIPTEMSYRFWVQIFTLRLAVDVKWIRTKIWLPTKISGGQRDDDIDVEVAGGVSTLQRKKKTLLF